MSDVSPDSWQKALPTKGKDLGIPEEAPPNSYLVFRFAKKPNIACMEVIRPQGPAPVGPYSPAVRVGPWVFISGQIALDEKGNLIRTTLEAEIEQVLTNLKSILQAAGLEPSNLVKVSIFLTDMAFFPIVNAAYEKLFTNGRYPARETVAVAALPRGARVEISAIAYNPHA